MRYLNAILVGLLIIAIAVIAWLYFNPKIEKVYVQLKPHPQIVYIEKSDGGTIAKTEEVQNDDISESHTESYLRYVNDTLVPALKIANNKINGLTKINAVLQDSLTKKDIVLNSIKSGKQKDEITWKTKYIEITANMKDSTAKYNYNAQIDLLKYQERESIFKDKKTVIAVTSPDKNLKVNGVTNFTKKFPPSKDFLEVNLKLQGLYLQNALIPYGGAELLLNPDGKLKPIVGYGYFYDNGTKQFLPYWMGGLQYNMIRF